MPKPKPAKPRVKRYRPKCYGLLAWEYADRKGYLNSHNFLTDEGGAIRDAWIAGFNAATARMRRKVKR
jgi:hypothetical protein